jgi:hypothetical protein
MNLMKNTYLKVKRDKGEMEKGVNQIKVQQQIPANGLYKKTKSSQISSNAIDKSCYVQLRERNKEFS